MLAGEEGEAEQKKRVRTIFYYCDPCSADDVAANSLYLINHQLRVKACAEAELRLPWDRWLGLRDTI